jgi:Domain of unknown function (DUF4169)
MGDIVNLRRMRKRVKRQLHEREAAAKRLLQGRSKAERETKRDAKARRDLDHHRIETGDNDEISGC